MFRGDHGELTLVGIFASILIVAPLCFFLALHGIPFLFILPLWVLGAVMHNIPWDTFTRFCHRLSGHRDCQQIEEEKTESSVPQCISLKAEDTPEPKHIPRNVRKSAERKHLGHDVRMFCSELRNTAWLVNEASGKRDGDYEPIKDVMDNTVLVLNRLASAVEQRPDFMSKCRRCDLYYLPQIRKMLDEYEYLADKRGSNNAVDARKSITKSFTLVYRNLSDIYDGLFASNALDASTDVVVLENLSGRI